MRLFDISGPALIAAVLCGCGSGGMTSGGTTSGGSSNCDAICFTGAELTVETSNTNGRLEGALVETCWRGTTCTNGILSRRDGGAGWFLSLSNAEGSATVEATVRAAADPDKLRIDVRWALAWGSDPGVTEGDTYSVSARVSEDGQELFSRSFVASYSTVKECGSTCKLFSGT
jgi:hypothetical protein